jgi:hypothetical protein
LETAKELRAALDRAIAAAEFEETEVRGKGAVPSLFGDEPAADFARGRTRRYCSKIHRPVEQ